MNISFPPLSIPALKMSGNSDEIKCAQQIAAKSGRTVLVKQLSTFMGYRWTQFARPDGSLYTVRVAAN